MSRGKLNKPDAAVLHSYLLKRNFTDDAYDTFFPPKNTKLSYKMAFPIDISQYKIDKPADFAVECYFDQGSPADYYVVMVIPEAVDIGKETPHSTWSTTASIA